MAGRNNPIAGFSGSGIPPLLPPWRPVIPSSPPPSYSLLPSTEGAYSSSNSQGDYDPAMRTSATPKSPPDYLSSVKRKPVLVYIQSFMGNETSFQSFPPIYTTCYPSLWKIWTGVLTQKDIQSSRLGTKSRLRQKDYQGGSRN